MRTLLVFRHGKSDWGADYDRDHNRPIAKRGRRASKLMGKYLASIDSIPDQVLTSSATRARQTVDLASESGRWGCPVRVTEQLYGASIDGVIDEIRSEPDTTHTLLIAGHEPTWSSVVSALSGRSIGHFPTAAIACIEFDIGHWSEIDYESGRLAWHVTPKQLKHEGFEG
jgi:phosphohistidine phosphatase